MPRTLKQYYRAVLVRLGLFNEGAFRLVIDDIYPDDTFIVSFPKSGNTWTRFLIASLLAPEKELNFRNLDEIIPDVYTAAELVNTRPRPRYIKAHDAWFAHYPKSIYIVRDYRDVLVSYYHFHTALGQFKGDFSGYVEKVNTLHPFGDWTAHVRKALDFREKHPDKILILRYEDLLRDTVSELKKIAAFCRLSPALPLEQIAERCRFENLKAKESAHGSLFMDKSGRHFFREGKEGGWKEKFGEEDLRAIAPALELMKELGY